MRGLGGFEATADSDLSAMRVWTHVHSKHSYDGHCSVEEIAGIAEQHGVGAILLSEHSDRWNEKGYMELCAHCTRWNELQTDPLLVPGLEVTSARGWHILCFGTRAWIQPSRPERDIIVNAQAQGAVVGLAHPSSKILAQAIVERLPFDLVEVWNMKRRRFAARWEQCERLFELRGTGVGWGAVIGLDAHDGIDFHAGYVDVRGTGDPVQALRRRNYTCVGGSFRIHPDGACERPLGPRARARLLSAARHAIKTVGTPIRLVAPAVHAHVKRVLRTCM